jgi:hypothetical protein
MLISASSLEIDDCVYVLVTSQASAHHRTTTERFFPRNIVSEAGFPVSVSSLGGIYGGRFNRAMKILCIPSSVTAMASRCFVSCNRVSAVVLERSCRVTVFADDAFAECQSLKSICIPSFVETLCLSCFRLCSRLCSATFAPGSRLSTLDRWVFPYCASLSSIRIPAAVESMTGWAFACSNVIILEVDKANPVVGVSANSILRVIHLFGILDLRILP